MFESSREQESIRSSARALYDSGLCLVGEWVKRIPHFTLQKWSVWEKTSGFMEWWIEVFPEHNGITLTDLRALEFEATRSLMRAVLSGDMQATKIVLQMAEAAKDAQGLSDNSLDDWYNGSSSEENGWESEWN